MFHIADQLCRTGCIYTVNRDFPFQPFRLMPADRTFIRDIEYDFIPFPCFRDGPDDVRNDVSCSLDQYPVPDAYIPFPDEVKIMQSGFAYCDPAADYRLEHRVRRQDACASDIDADVFKDRCHFPRGEFQCDLSPGIFPDKAKAFRQRQIVDLDHDAIYIKVNGFPDFCPAVQPAEHGFKIFVISALIADREPQLSQIVQPFPLGIRDLSAFMEKDLIGIDRKRASGGHVGILLPETAGRSISGIQPGLFSLCDQFGIQFLEITVEHENFTADNEDIRNFDI